MKTLEQRLKQHASISKTLSGFSDKELLAILANAKPIHKSIGGTAALIPIDEIPIFVKKIPLTAIEQLPKNIKSTANIFNLPLYYQYGVGSAGFGAWRELSAHIMTTNWVLEGECKNFPIMFHYRILPNNPSDLNIRYWKDIEKYNEYWENSNTIRQRIEALNQATSHIALFLEYVPQNLYQWFNSQMTKGDNSYADATLFINENLKATNKFIKAKGFIHFDAHFENILTDGENFLLSDFGLALSSRFELSKAEIIFSKQHQNYDQCCATVNLLHCIFTNIYGKEHWEVKLQKYLINQLEPLEPSVDKIIREYGPIALKMDDFFQKLQKESKQIPYPFSELQKMLKAPSP